MNRSVVALTFTAAGLLILALISFPTSTRAPTTQTQLLPAESADEAELAVREFSEPGKLTILAGGDVMLGRQVETNMVTYGSNWPLSALEATTGDADLTLVNLESPFSTTGASSPTGSLILRGYPKGIETLRQAGIDYVSLANNHITDMSLAGLKETKELLSAADIAFSGAGESEEEAYRPAVLVANNQTVAIFSMTYGVNFTRQGVHWASIKDRTKIAQAFQTYQDTSALRLAMVHFGSEYQAQANASQKDFAHYLIELGFDAVIGHHPHVPQEIEVYQNKPILYSLGNLVVDQQPGEFRDQSALAKLTYSDRTIEQIDLLPYRIYRYGQPKLLTELHEKQAVWQRFGLPQGSLVFN